MLIPAMSSSLSVLNQVSRFLSSSFLGRVVVIVLDVSLAAVLTVIILVQVSSGESAMVAVEASGDSTKEKKREKH